MTISIYHCVKCTFASYGCAPPLLLFCCWWVLNITRDLKLSQACKLWGFWWWGEWVQISYFKDFKLERSSSKPPTEDLSGRQMWKGVFKTHKLKVLSIDWRRDAPLAHCSHPRPFFSYWSSIRWLSSITMTRQNCTP